MLMSTEEIRQKIYEKFPEAIITEFRKQLCYGGPSVHLNMTIRRKGMRHAANYSAFGSMRNALLSLARQVGVEVDDK